MAAAAVVGFVERVSMALNCAGSRSSIRWWFVSVGCGDVGLFVPFGGGGAIVAVGDAREPIARNIFFCFTFLDALILRFTKCCKNSFD